MSLRSTSLAAFGRASGRITLALGLFFLSFAGYQLWGTGLAEAAAQDDLADELTTRLATARRPASVWPVPASPVGGADRVPMDRADVALVGGPAQPAAIPLAQPEEALVVEVGEPFANLRIPSIGVDKTVVAGTTREALRTGPGHYLGTAMPGHRGNVAIAGHRTTYGAPFHDIDRLTPGDPIVVETTEGVFTYRVEAQTMADGTTSGHRIVAPEKVDVIADKGDHRLTLTACHPRYSARQRIIVTAVLDDPEPVATSDTSGPDRRSASVRVPLPASPTAFPDDGRAASRPGPSTMAGPTIELDDGLGWQPTHALATATWAGLGAMIGAAAWVIGRLWRRLPAYLMAVPSLTLCLLTCFSHLDRLLPAS